MKKNEYSSPFLNFMVLTPHILTGVAIITKTQNPILGLVLVFLSHYFLDCFPAQEYSIKNIRERRWNKSFLDFLKVFFDISFGGLLAFFLSGNNPLFFAAVFLAILPDSLALLNIIFSENKLLAKHQRLHVSVNAIGKNKKLPSFWGVASQAATAALAIFSLL